MLIRCPKCDVSYEIEPSVVPEDGKKVRCSQCGEVWVCQISDVFESRPPSLEDESLNLAPQVETSENVTLEENFEVVEDVSQPMPAPEVLKPEKTSEMQEIFARLETQTETLFNIEKSLPPHQKIWWLIKRNLGLHRRQTRRLYLACFVVLFTLMLFYLRFEIVRVAPFMERIYESCGIVCVIPGEGLEFQNITRDEFEEDYISKMEIRGFITNVTGKTLDIPTIQVEILDKNVQPLQVLYQEPPVKRIIAGSKVAFRIMINKPSTFSKYVYLTFTEDTPEGMIKAINTRPIEAD